MILLVIDNNEESINYINAHFCVFYHYFFIRLTFVSHNKYKRSLVVALRYGKCFIELLFFFLLFSRVYSQKFLRVWLCEIELYGEWNLSRSFSLVRSIIYRGFNVAKCYQVVYSTGKLTLGRRRFFFLFFFQEIRSEVDWSVSTSMRLTIHSHFRWLSAPSRLGNKKKKHCLGDFFSPRAASNPLVIEVKVSRFGRSKQSGTLTGRNFLLVVDHGGWIIDLWLLGATPETVSFTNGRLPQSECTVLGAAGV